MLIASLSSLNFLFKTDVEFSVLLEVTASLHFDSTVSLGNWDRKARHAFVHDYLYIIVICINRDFFCCYTLSLYSCQVFSCVTNFFSLSIIIQKNMVDFNTCRLQNLVQLQQLTFTGKETSLAGSSNSRVFLHTKQQKCKYG